MSAPEQSRLPRSSAAADQHSHSTRNGLLCAVLVAACVLITNPTANMPFSDDFSYTRTALDFARTGHILYNGWATAMLGWQILWGALFIKLFGFSFIVMRLSMLPIAMASVYLFHQILRRFGINPPNAILGALTMGLSPLYLPMAASFMTDVPGVFVILVCIYMCQRAVAARTDKAALIWLCSAMLVNVAGGTVRQIAWLGALVMVPSTAWLLRKRRGMKTAGVLIWLAGLVGVLACMHWFSRQPYSVPQPVFGGPVHIKMLLHMCAQLLKTALCLLLLVFPILIAWLPTQRRLATAAKLWFLCAIGVVAAAAIALYLHGNLNGWLLPWLTPVLVVEGMLIPPVFGISSAALTFSITLVISFLILASAIALMAQIAGGRRRTPSRPTSPIVSGDPLGWILFPFSLSYLLLLAPIGIYDRIQDRYVLGLVPIAIVVLLKLYQEKISAGVSRASVIALLVFAAYAVAATHDFSAESKTLGICNSDTAGFWSAEEICFCRIFQGRPCQ